MHFLRLSGSSKRTLFFLLAGGGLAALSFLTVHAMPREIPVEFGLLLKSENPINGSVSCVAAEPCKLLEKNTFQLSVTIDVAADGKQSTLSISCGTTPCSFSNGKPKTAIGNKRQFDFYEGIDAVEILLVQKPKVQIGRLLLHYP